MVVVVVRLGIATSALAKMILIFALGEEENGFYYISACRKVRMDNRLISPLSPPFHPIALALPPVHDVSAASEVAPSPLFQYLDRMYFLLIPYLRAIVIIDRQQCLVLYLLFAVLGSRGRLVTSPVWSFGNQTPLPTCRYAIAKQLRSFDSIQ